MFVLFLRRTVGLFVNDLQAGQESIKGHVIHVFLT